MVARATGTASPLGRFLDGLCDHGVFVLIYVALAISIGSLGAWTLGTTAGLLHALQSSLYEGERARFHRRSIGVAAAPPTLAGNALVRGYDRVVSMVDKFARPFDELLRRDPDSAQLGASYGALASKPLHFMSLLSANVRVFAVFIACLAGNPALFWWFEIGPLMAVLAIGLAWHRSVEAHLVAAGSAHRRFRHARATHSKDVTN